MYHPDGDGETTTAAVPTPSWKPQNTHSPPLILRLYIIHDEIRTMIMKFVEL